MSDSPYTEGWPKSLYDAFYDKDTQPRDDQVVPLSDSERLREALEKLADETREEALEHHHPVHERLYAITQAALSPERGK